MELHGDKAENLRLIDFQKTNLVRVPEVIQGQKGQETIANSQKIQIFVG